MVSFSLNIYSVISKYGFIFFSDETFSLQLLSVDGLTLYDVSGEVQTFDEASCPCSHTLQNTRIIGVKVQSSQAVKGFVMCAHLPCFPAFFIRTNVVL